MDNVALRKTLFDTLEMLKKGTIDLDKAKAINDTAQTIINCAKVEVDYMRVSGVKVTGGFVSQKPQPEKQIQTLRTTRSGVCPWRHRYHPQDAGLRREG